MLQPSLSFCGGGVEQRTERQGRKRFDTAKRQRGFANLIQAGHSINPRVVPRRGVHRHQQMGRTTGEEFGGEGVAFLVFEGKARQQHAIKKALQQGRNTAPPDGKNQHQMLGPGDVGLRMEQIRLQRLNLSIPFMQHRIKAQRTKAQYTYLVACACRRRDITVAQRATKTVGRRVAQNHQHSLAH